MRLKSVELSGFKSFPDRTLIEFGSGITAILGPNGCGKSNVVDAIKWVLGEKSAKNLRGEEMLDVIFSGCETRSASALAEVKLAFDNTDQVLPVPYNEVVVSRRLYRSRESEYFINQNRCRLRDIRDLFLDTGVGGSAYSVIEQGRVEALLHAKPADRRAVFEEAAGIAKFKVRRKEILSRLERTDQVLLRINDRVEDKERHIRRVGVQAANARRHRRISEELDSLKTFLYRRQFAERAEVMRDLQAKRRALAEEIGREDAALAAALADLARLTAEEAELAANRDSVQEASSGAQEELARIQLDHGGAVNRLNALKADIARGSERRNELTARIERLRSDEAELASALEAARAAQSDLDERFSRQDGERLALAATAETAEREVTEVRNRVIDLNRGRQDLVSAAGRLDAAGQSHADRLADLDARLARLDAEGKTIDAAIDAAEKAHREAAESFGALADEAEAGRTRLARMTADADALLREERALDSERAAKASRKATLEDLENSLAGAFDGVRNAVTAARRGEAACRGVIGMALDLMTIPTDLALAIETALGGSAQNIVTNNALDAQSAIEHLKRNRLGRATFLPLDRIQPRRRLDRDFRRFPGVVGEAVDLVSYDPRYRTVMEHLLAGVLVVDTLGLARELAAREARGVKIVTLEGDVISPSGAMTGGHERQRGGGLVQRKAELHALAAELAACEARLAEKSTRREEMTLAAAGLRRDIAGMEARMAESGRAEAGLGQNLAARRSERERLDRDRREASAERGSIAETAGNWRDDLAAVRVRLAEVDKEMSALEADAAAKTEAQRSARCVLDALGEEFARLSGERATAAAATRELDRRLHEARRERDDCERVLGGGDGSFAEAEAEIEALRERMARLGEREAEALRLRDEYKAAGAELLERMARLREAMDARRGDERGHNSQIARIREGVSHLDRQTAECEVKMENLREKARAELGIDDLSPVGIETRPDAPDGLAGDGDPDRASSVPAGTPPPEAAPPWVGMSDADLQRQAEALAQKLKNIGPVNPDAIDELAELEAGAEFLRSQREDLQTAVQDMRRTVDKLNQESSTRFQETFVVVRENFQRMFTRLFGGGKADLILEETVEPGADPLEAGIDIRAQPPGKEPKSISLLSGGEKALCAVALLFALFRSKPSPFCILDEVDGPLDESNIDRFMQQLKDFAVDTQFIIISHSQRTMSMTDVLWGVTQQEPGISAIHSLRFNAFGGENEAAPETKERAAVNA